MKKTFLVIPILAVVAICVGTVTALQIEGQKDNVSAIETALYGDKSAAYGIQMTQQYVMNDARLFWDTTFTIGEELAVDTAYTYHRDSRAGSSKIKPYMDVHSVLNFSTSTIGNLLDTTSNSNQFRYKDIIVDMASRTQNGEVRTERLNLIDYYEYYPQEYGIEAVVDGEYLYSDRGTDSTLLQAYFQEAIDPEHRIEMTIYKAENGDVREASMQSEFSYSSLVIASAFVDSAIYAVPYFYPDEDSPTPAPTARMGQIHRIDLAKLTDNELIVTHIEPVYQLPEGAEFLEIATRTDETELLLLTRESGQLVLTILALPTMQEKQRIVLEDTIQGRYSNDTFYQQDDFIVIQRGEGYLTLILQDETGYTLAFTERYYEETIAALLEKEFYIKDTFYIEDTQMDYRDGRLAVFFQMFKRNHNDGIPHLSVVSKDGIEYMARYDVSLLQQMETYFQYSDLVLVPDFFQPTVAFK